MKKRFDFRIKKRSLLAVAGSVWLAAGINVARLGVIAWGMSPKLSAAKALLSIAVFAAFFTMFRKMSLKHSARIFSYKEDTRPFWNFFDLKAYLIMTFMMGGGIWLRSSGLVSSKFIAVFYTGLGLALALAGVLFWCNYFKYKDNFRISD